MSAADLHGTRALVTGAYGLVGGWLTNALLAGGASVTVLRRDHAARSALAAMGLQDRVSIVHGDILDDGLVARVLAEYEIDTVFHLAAQTLVPIANRSPISTFETNMRGTWLLLEACRHHHVARVVVASSDKAYGLQPLPYREDAALEPQYPYDVSKAATDLIARSYWHTFGLPVAVTRFANIYGGGDFNASRLVPEAVDAALAGRAPIVRSDGSPERDFLYVEDAVAAYLAIAAALGRGELRRRGVQRRLRAPAPGARRRLADLRAGGHRRGARDPRHRHAGGRDRPPMGRLRQAACRTWAGRRPSSCATGCMRTIDWYRANDRA